MEANPRVKLAATPDPAKAKDRKQDKRRTSGLLFTFLSLCAHRHVSAAAVQMWEKAPKEWLLISLGPKAQS